MSLDDFLAVFKPLAGGSNFADAEPVIREIAAEPQPVEQADKIALAARLLDAAVLLLNEPKKRGSK